LIYFNLSENSSMTDILPREPNGGLNQTAPNGHAGEVANGMPFSYAFGTPNGVGENRVNGAERCPSPVVLYESEDKELPNLVPIIKQENEGASESFSEYEGISKQFLFCHLCIKHLPDAMVSLRIGHCPVTFFMIELLASRLKVT
jgi:hypothetical protein